MRSRLLAVLATAAAAALALPIGSAAGADAPQRPTISSFYARDEGPTIHLRVNFCDVSNASRLRDSYSAVFRIWEEDSGYQVVERRVSGRIHAYCGSASLKVPDTLANGLYSANAAVVNRTQGGMIRLRARYFSIT